ncbi:MAG: protein-S-isoprenylcysteine O-methyltransferase Ste14 [Halieaceae bacterium]|jgi:protein-S-isoprenylcysteine O-methyltransferase Ste14
MVKRFIYPPMWLVFGVVLIFVFNETLPGARYTSTAGQVAGALIILIGLAMLVVAGGMFKKAGTDLVPFKTVSALVTTGLFRFTRNPMYLAMALVLLGCAVTVGASTALIVPPVFMVIIEMRFIRPEEAMLRDLFGEEYSSYCQRVRRWV